MDQDAPCDLRIPLPGLVFVGQGHEYRVFAVKRRPTRDTARLYQAPCPNVYQDGQICTGTATFPECSPQTIHEAAKLFFASHFNSDLAVNRCGEPFADNVLDLWRDLAERGTKTFPASVLRETSNQLKSLY